MTSIDGTTLQMMFGNGGGALRWFKINQAMAQEVTMSTGNTAESLTGVVVTNVVLKCHTRMERKHGQAQPLEGCLRRISGP